MASYAQALLPGLAEDFEVVVAARGDGPLRQVGAQAGMRSVELRHMRRSVQPRPRRARDGRARRPHPPPSARHRACAQLQGRRSSAAWPRGSRACPSACFTVHGWSFAPYSPPASWLFVWLERLMRPLTDPIVCPADAVRAAGHRRRERAMDDRTVVIPNAVEVGGVRALDAASGPPLVLSVGRLAFPKDFETLVRSLAMVDRGALSTAIVGDGPQRTELQQQIAALAAWTARCGSWARATTCPSSSRGRGSSSSPAARSACPCRSSRRWPPACRSSRPPSVASPSWSSTSAPGSSCRRATRAALAAALSRLAGDAGLRRRMGEAGRARAEEHFDVSGFRRAHVELYARQLASGAAQRAASASWRSSIHSVLTAPR